MQSPQLNKSSVDTTSQKFHLKTIENKSTVDITISNAIRKGTVKNYIKNGLSNVCDISVDDRVDKGLEGHLLDLKKSCSQLTRQVKNKECETGRYKDEVGFTLQKAKKIKDNRQRLEDRIAQLERNLNQINAKNQSATHSCKTYEHILQRMKKDDIYKQLQKNQMERQLRNLQRDHGITQTKNFSAKQFEKLSQIGLKQANDQLSLQNSIRKNKLSSINKHSNKKMDIQNTLNQKQKQTSQIHELAIGDIKDADLERLKKFLTVQIFLKSVLKSKTNKLKQHFLPYENAFFQIRSSTSVRDAGSLKSQFLNFEKNHNQKTEWVTHLQEQIAQASQTNSKLKQKLSQVMLGNLEIVEKLEGENKKQVNHGEIKKLHQKSFLFESTWERINSWIKIQASKLKIDKNSKDQQSLLKQIIQKLNQPQNTNIQAKQLSLKNSQHNNRDSKASQISQFSQNSMKSGR